MKEVPQLEVGQPFQADAPLDSVRLESLDSVRLESLDSVRLESLTYAKLMHYPHKGAVSPDSRISFLYRTMPAPPKFRPALLLVRGCGFAIRSNAEKHTESA